MRFDRIPKSLALIPDGNRRWARSNGLSVLEGYNFGVNKFIDFSEWCRNYGINNLTVWALSSENTKRSTHELHALFNIYRKACKDKNLINRLEENEIKLNIISKSRSIPKDLSLLFKKLEDRTENNKKGVINMLIGYGGKDDIVFAAKKITTLVKEGYRINEEMIKNCLMSFKVPDIDFVIRTSGEIRLSGFMPWQAGYAELYFSKKLWPDFTKHDLYNAISDYNRRERRFGK